MKNENKRHNKTKGQASRKDKTQSRSKGKDQHSGDSVDINTNHNDIRWYVNDPQLLKDACNLSYSNVLSDPIPLGIEIEGINNPTLTTPGIMVLDIVPSIGDLVTTNTLSSTDVLWDSAVNMSARSQWSFIRQKNSGARNYDAADLMIYHLAMDNAYMYWSWLVRIYGIMRTYSFKNKYYPRAILRSMGLGDEDITELQGKMADFRTYINLLAAQLSSFAVPNNLSYVSRHLWLYQNIFMDAANSKGQTYLFNPAGFYRFIETDGPGRLDFIGRPNAHDSDRGDEESFLDYLRRYGAQLLQPILLSEDMNTMSGDILKAYGESGIYAFKSIPDDFSIAPVIDNAILSQIHNSKVVMVNSLRDSSIRQDPDVNAGFLYQNIDFSDWSQVQAAILDSPFESPTPGDTMYDTRLCAVESPYSTESNKILSTGSEIVVATRIAVRATDPVAFRIYGFDVDLGTFQNLNTIIANPATPASATNLPDVLYYLMDLGRFDWHPLFMHIMRMKTSSSGDVDDVRVFGDLTNYAIVPADVIYKMHKVALNTQFGLPYVLTSL